MTQREEFEKHWYKVRKNKAKRELERHVLQPQVYAADNANRHWVTWQAAQAAQQVQPGWMPIASAPKDGAEVIVGRPDVPTNRKGAYIAGCACCASYMEEKWVYPNHPEVRSTLGDFGEVFEPTHWMPLPPPPIHDTKEQA